MRDREIDPARGIAIKRNVHEMEIDAPAERVAAALLEVLAEPDAKLGPIRIRRTARGPFTVGERFKGVVSLEKLPVPRMLARFVGWIGENLLADHCEIVELAPLRARYRYVSPTPFAGESTIELVPLGPSRCRLVQTFAYQERSWRAMFALQLFGVRLHDRALVAQAERAASLAGGTIRATTLTPEPR